ncbi:hypothetical protein TPB0596_01020 [Tsukamurella pulmonis]|uniref:hypothetical protein n=1 Tax=Tsukamurella pulmonis TaxID=47312 RepID=UPI001EDD00C7|nr:hypothetical protein [Tsukamurella pulmonis]BDD80339.1 hypothetical protein TPB0596_01020 [Tsukamurella pulmonis]
MISPITAAITVSNELFAQAIVVIDRSRADTLIEDYYRATAGTGGRTPSGIRYTMRAVLVAGLLIVMLQRPPTIRAILAMISDFSDQQLDQVGMGGQDLTAARSNSKRAYAKFHAWLSRRLEPLDSSPDIRARRTLNKDHRDQIASRTLEQREQSIAARERIADIVNSIVLGSIHDTLPEGFVGDLVADESTFDLAGDAYDLGAAPGRKRAAAYCGNYYARDRVVKTTDPADVMKLAGKGKAAFGLGLTAITRVGPPHALRSIPPVIVGISLHRTTSGDGAAVAEAIDQARRNGLLPDRPGGCRWPPLVVDMGYNPKEGFADLMIDRRYAWVGRYPKSWNIVHPAAPSKPDGPLPGPIQIAGAFYCPAAAKLAKQFSVQSTSVMLRQSPPGFLRHDDRLAAMLPMLMGQNSRPFRAQPTAGKPLTGRHRPAEVTKIKLVCPASMGRVRCPLKPSSMTAEADIPLLEPERAAATYRCCTNGSVTVTLTPAQLKRAQWGAPPGSWEHTLHFEAARALTEQRFSILKSRSVTGIEHLKFGARREPMIKLFLALAVAAANLNAQEAYERRTDKTESVRTRWRMLTEDLGHPPTRTPPRT